MDLKPHDLHLTFDGTAERLRVWDATHAERFACEARNRTVNEGLGHWGECPPGSFLLGIPRFKNTPPFGRHFVPILDYLNHHAMRDFNREGIGLHGGGSGLKNPFADHQGWASTHGCIRLQNLDLEHVVQLVNAAQEAGGQCYLTVTGTGQ